MARRLRQTLQLLDFNNSLAMSSALFLYVTNLFFPDEKTVKSPNLASKELKLNFQQSNTTIITWFRYENKENN